MDRNIKLLSLGFALIFFGYNGTQQYITAYFESLGQFNLGFNVLIIVYCAFMLSSPLSPVPVFRFRARTLILIAAIFFSLFIVSLLSRIELFIYVTAAMLGIAAAVMWTAQNTYIIRISKSDVYGAHSGFFTTIFNLGTGLGIIFFGYIMVQYSFDLSIIIFSTAPIIGLIIMLRLKEPPYPKEEKREPLKLMKKAALSSTVLRLSSIWFSFTFVMGLAIGILPIQINHTLGMQYIGILSSLFFLLPIATSYAFGRLSDVTGRTRLISYSYLLGFLGLVILYFAAEAMGLILGIVLLALNYSLLRPITMALPGDLAIGDNLVILTALFWTMRIVGVFTALTISVILPVDVIYVVSLGVLLISFLLVLPILKFSLSKLKQRINYETGQKEPKNP